MGWRGGTGGEESHVDTVLLSSSTLREDDRAQFDVGVEKLGLVAGPVDTDDPGGGAKQIQTSLKWLTKLFGAEAF